MVSTKNDSIRAIIIDDESGCISFLSHYIACYCPLIKIVGTGQSEADFKKLCDTIEIDIAFIDIHLFNENAFDILEKCKPINFDIIFVTAYDSYAIKAFRFEALDYILKPLLKEDILRCYNKVLKKYNDSESTVNGPLSKFIIKSGSKIDVVDQQQIVYFFAKGPYTDVAFNSHNKYSRHVISKSIGEIEKSTSRSIFFRVHKSYLINVKKISEITKGELCLIKMENGEAIPVAHRRVHDFLLFYTTNK